MPLEYQHVPMNIQGLDTKTDDKNVVSGKFIIAENCQMQKSGRIQSRYGYAAGTGGNVAHIVAGLAGENPLAIRPGFIDQLTTSAKSTATSLVNIPASNGVDLPSVRGEAVKMLASNGTNRAMLVSYGNSTIRLSRVNMDDQSEIVSTYATSTLATTRICAGASKFALITATGSSRAIFTSNADTAFVSVPNTPFAASPYQTHDIAYNSLQTLGAAWVDAGQLYFASWDNDSAWSSVKSIGVGSFAATTVSIARGSSSGSWNILVVLGVSAILYTVTSTGSLSLTQNYTMSGYTDATNSIVVPGGGGFMVQGKTMSGPTPTSFGVCTSSGVFIPNMKIAAKAAGNYVTLVNADVSKYGTVTASILRSGASTYTVFYLSSGVLTPVFSYASGRADIGFGTDEFGEIPLSFPSFTAGGYFFADRITNYIEQTTGNFQLNMATAYKVSADLPMWVEFNGSAYTNAFGDIQQISTSLLGPQPKGVAFPFPPAIPVLTEGSGSLAVGVYQVTLVYETIDAQGRLIYSAPSAPVSFTTTGASKSIIISIATMYDQFAPVNITAYMTKKDGTIFYRINELNAATGTVTAAVEPTGSEQALYTTGGALDAGNPGLSAGVFVARDRLWSISAEDRNVVFFSTISAPTEVPRFNEGLYVNVPDLGGKLTAVAEMDEKIILLKENAIYITYGQGPDNLGVGEYPAPQLISQSMGCKYARSVVLTDAGVMFMSNEGIWIISRGLQLQYLGAPVEAYNALTITGAMNLVDRHQVWFFSSEGTTLVWDDFHSLWYTFTQQPTKAQILLTDGTPTFVNSSTGTYLKENKLAYTDNGISYKMRVKTGWVTLTGIQGFQRFRRLQWSGAAFDAMTVTLYYDFSTTLSETFIITPDVAPAFQKEIKPARQKCEAIQINMQSADMIGPMSISAFSIEAGAKKGTNRLALSKRIQGV